MDSALIRLRILSDELDRLDAEIGISLVFMNLMIVY